MQINDIEQPVPINLNLNSKPKTVITKFTKSKNSRLFFTLMILLAVFLALIIIAFIVVVVRTKLNFFLFDVDFFIPSLKR